MDVLIRYALIKKGFNANFLERWKQFWWIPRTGKVCGSRSKRVAKLLKKKRKKRRSGRKKGINNINIRVEVEVDINVDLRSINPRAGSSFINDPPSVGNKQQKPYLDGAFVLIPWGRRRLYHTTAANPTRKCLIRSRRNRRAARSVSGLSCVEPSSLPAPPYTTGSLKCEHTHCSAELRQKRHDLFYSYIATYCTFGQKIYTETFV